MTLSLQDIPLAMLMGIGATAVMDAWLLLLKRLGVPTLNFAFIDRWVDHLLRGQVAHAAIAKAAPVRGELAWHSNTGRNRRRAMKSLNAETAEVLSQVNARLIDLQGRSSPELDAR